MDNSEKIKMKVEMEVTIPQALALQAMFKHWNRLGSWGSSRFISFFVDGDGNFRPNASWFFSERIPELTEELETAAIVEDDGNGNLKFDFDSIAWKLRED